MHGAVHSVRLSSTASRLEVQEVRCNSFFTIIMVIITSHNFIWQSSNLLCQELLTIHKTLVMLLKTRSLTLPVSETSPPTMLSRAPARRAACVAIHPSLSKERNCAKHAHDLPRQLKTGDRFLKKKLFYWNSSEHQIYLVLVSKNRLYI